MTIGSDRRARLARARLYFVTDAGAGPGVVRAALEGGADMVQLRDPALADAELMAAAAPLRALCDEHDALLWINDRPDLALRCGADGVHLGQDDMPPAEARELAGPELLVGLSTHSQAQFDAGVAAGADQLSVGPVWETPTKPGRPAVGLGLVRQVAARRPDDAVVCHRRDRRRRTRRRWPRPVPSGWWWCGRSATRPTRAPRPRRSGLRWTEAGLAQRDSRKRRKQRQRAATARRRPLPSQRPTPRRARDRWPVATPAGGPRTTPHAPP